MRRVDLGIGTFTDGREVLAALGLTDVAVSIAATADLDALVARVAELEADNRRMREALEAIDSPLCSAWADVERIARKALGRTG